MIEVLTLPTSYRAMHHLGAGAFEAREHSVPTPAPSDSLIAVEAAGLCGTDLHITHVSSTYACDTDVLGHEICGRMVDGPAELVGRRVVVDPTLTCGTCEPCRRGFITQCVHFSTIGIAVPGGFAELATVPTDRVVPIADHVPAATATLAEPLSCVLYALSRLPMLEPAGRAVVLGGGPIGVLFTAVLERALARQVVVVEPSEFRAQHIVERFDADVVAPGEVPADFGPEVVVDAAGFLFAEAVKLARPGGVILCFGLENRGGVSSQVDFTQKELTAVAARAAFGTFGKAVELLERGIIVGEDVISATYDLADIGRAFADARGGQGLKVVLEPRSRDSVGEPS